MTTPTQALPYYPQGAWPDVVITQTTTWVSSSVQLNSLVITNGATLYVSGTTMITANHVTIAYSLSLSTDGLGFGLGDGPGAGGSSGYRTGGGGHGGYGGQGTNSDAFGGASYGSVYQPVSLGSGAGSLPLGGVGGGAIRLVVSNTLTLQGSISVNGISATHTECDGAGGSIWIQVGVITGAGAIRANGGNGGINGNRQGGSAGGAHRAVC